MQEIGMRPARRRTHGLTLDLKTNFRLPLRPSPVGGILKRSTRADCKSAGYAFTGSNPVPTTTFHPAWASNAFA